MKHKAEDCPLVAHRITCEPCGYPQCESQFDSVQEYEVAMNKSVTPIVCPNCSVEV